MEPGDERGHPPVRPGSCVPRRHERQEICPVRAEGLDAVTDHARRQHCVRVYEQQQLAFCLHAQLVARPVLAHPIGRQRLSVEQAKPWIPCSQALDDARGVIV